MNADHSAIHCAIRLQARWAGLGADVLATDTTPEVLSPYTVDLRCEHGVTYWIDPTHQQVITWALRDEEQK